MFKAPSVGTQGSIPEIASKRDCFQLLRSLSCLFLLGVAARLSVAFALWLVSLAIRLSIGSLLGLSVARTDSRCACLRHGADARLADRLDRRRRCLRRIREGMRGPSAPFPAKLASGCSAHGRVSKAPPVRVGRSIGRWQRDRLLILLSLVPLARRCRAFGSFSGSSSWSVRRPEISSSREVAL